MANCFTISRILGSLCLFLLSPSSVAFAVLYFLCGVTDVLDGFLTRKLHTESKMGERLDSIADLFFAVAYAVRIFPLFRLSIWIWIWTVLIAAVKIFCILQTSKKERKFCVAHSYANKLTGFLLFLLPLTVRLSGMENGAAVVCAAATVAATEELSLIWKA